MNRERQPMSYSGIFFDSADLVKLEEWMKTGVLGGATTNPKILNASGVVDVPAHIEKMVAIAGKSFPISIEIPDASWSVANQVDLAKKYTERFPDNAVIKVPMDPRNPRISLEVINELGQSGIRVNATLAVTGGQLVLAAEALRHNRRTGHDSYISLFWNRRNEARTQMIEEELQKRSAYEPDRVRVALEKQIYDAAEILVETLRYLTLHGLNHVRVIIGSLRNPWDVDQAINAGADIVTVSPELLEKWVYTKRGVDTTEEMNNAFRSVQDKIKLI